MTRHTVIRAACAQYYTSWAIKLCLQNANYHQSLNAVVCDICAFVQTLPAHRPQGLVSCLYTVRFTCIIISSDRQVWCTWALWCRDGTESMQQNMNRMGHTAPVASDTPVQHTKQGIAWCILLYFAKGNHTDKLPYVTSGVLQPLLGANGPQRTKRAHASPFCAQSCSKQYFGIRLFVITHFNQLRARPAPPRTKQCAVHVFGGPKVNGIEPIHAFVSNLLDMRKWWSAVELGFEWSKYWDYTSRASQVHISSYQCMHLAVLYVHTYVQVEHKLLACCVCYSNITYFIEPSRRRPVECLSGIHKQLRNIYITKSRHIHTYTLPFAQDTH